MGYDFKNRRCVEEFGDLMELRLLDNDHKGGWNNMSLAWLLTRLEEETRELEVAIEHENCGAISHEAADVANFAMMITDVANTQWVKRAAKIVEDDDENNIQN